MSERNRELPSWMSKKEKEKETLKEPLKSRRKPKVARTVFYCMNEKELVEAAVSRLTNCAQPQRGHQPPEVTEEAGPELKASEASCGESPDGADRSDVSESDLDVTEVETVPYAANEEAEDDKEAPDEDRQDGNKDGGSRETPKPEENEDEAFRLVREIFFT